MKALVLLTPNQHFLVPSRPGQVVRCLVCAPGPLRRSVSYVTVQGPSWYSLLLT